MRVAAWIFVVSTALGAIAVFVPAIELAPRGIGLGRHASRSLYQLNTDRDLVRGWFGRGGRSQTRRYGLALANVLVDSSNARARRFHVDDARDAMGAFDEVDPAAVDRAAIGLHAVTLGLLALEAIMIVLAFPASQGARHRKRTIVAAGLAVVIAAVAIALHLVYREVVWQVNDELGGTVLALGPGAYAIGLAAVAALAAIATTLVMMIRAPRSPRIG